MCGGDALALNNFQFGRPLRSAEAQRVEHPVPSNSAKVPHQGFVFVRRNWPNYLIGSALNDYRINTCMGEEAQGISDKAGQ